MADLSVKVAGVSFNNPLIAASGTFGFGREYGKPCQVSLEERMGCGVGACLVCAVKVRKNGEEVMQHVCKNGPVFNAEEVVF